MALAFDVARAHALLSPTPGILSAWLSGLSSDVVMANEGPDTWSPFDIVGHLIHGEKTDWMPRVMLILERGADGEFAPFDRHAQFNDTAGRSLDDLLDEFARLRRQNLEALAALDLQPADLDRTGRHPALGIVTLKQLLATWVVHDYDHLMQISRVIGSQWASDVGPWRAYLRIVSGNPG